MNYTDSGSGAAGDKRSKTMASAAAILSVISISTVCCVYIPFVCGSLGIILALLSRGGERTMSPNAKTALCVSTVAMFTTAALLACSVAVVFMQYGSFDAFWKEYMELLEAYRMNP